MSDDLITSVEAYSTLHEVLLLHEILLSHDVFNDPVSGLMCVVMDNIGNLGDSSKMAFIRC
jgi:hypothetical protein